MFVAKLPAGALRDIAENEYLTTIAGRALLPDDEIVEPEIATPEGIKDRALLVPRLRSVAQRHQAALRGVQ